MTIANIGSLLLIIISTLFISIGYANNSNQQETVPLKPDTLTINLYHKFGLASEDFKLRGSILVRPRSEYRSAQYQFIDHPNLSDSDLAAIKEASRLGGVYSIKASLRQKKGSDPVRTTRTFVRTCSLYTSNLVDKITVNLDPTNSFININIATSDPDCLNSEPAELSRKFNTTLVVDSGSFGPSPNTESYIKRLEEERKIKQGQGKEDNRSFFAKYWMYIVPAVLILMVFSGPEQGAR